MSIQESNLTLPSEGRILNAFMTHPAGAGPYPAVVVIQEVYGLNDNIRGITRRFAEEGYAALAIDLYSGGLKVLCVLQTIQAVLSSNTDNYAILTRNPALPCKRHRRVSRLQQSGLHRRITRMA